MGIVNIALDIEDEIKESRDRKTSKDRKVSRTESKKSLKEEKNKERNSEETKAPIYEEIIKNETETVKGTDVINNNA